MEKDILEILENKSDAPFIISSRKLIKQIAKKSSQEEIETILEETKKEIDKLLETKYHRVKEIYNNGKIDEEKLEFALKIINKDEQIYKQIEELKTKKDREKKIKDLLEIKEHIKNTINELSIKIERISSKQQKNEKTSIIKKILKKKPEKDEQTEQLQEIINVIEQSKTIYENKELKESYLVKESIHEAIDMLYEKCKAKDLKGLQQISITLQKKYKKVIENIDADLNKLKNTTEKPKEYDERLIEYVYNKQKNYITQSIDHSENNKMYTHLLTILKLINELDKEQIKTENLKQETIEKINEIIDNYKMKQLENKLNEEEPNNRIK